MDSSKQTLVHTQEGPIESIIRGLLRIQSNICAGAFLRKLSKAFSH